MPPSMAARPAADFGCSEDTFVATPVAPRPRGRRSVGEEYAHDFAVCLATHFARFVVDAPAASNKNRPVATLLCVEAVIAAANRTRPGPSAAPALQIAMRGNHCHNARSIRRRRMNALK